MEHTDGHGHPRAARAAGAAAALGLSLALAGCGITIPSDPNGTLDAVRGAELRVGVSPDPGLVQVHGDEPSGPIVQLVESFADSIDADVDWTVGSEENLVGTLEAGDLDLVAGGITSDTPWVDRVGVTRGYRNIPGADGRAIVLLIPEGENAFLARLETFLDEEVGS